MAKASKSTAYGKHRLLPSLKIAYFAVQDERQLTEI